MQCSVEIHMYVECRNEKLNFFSLSMVILLEFSACNSVALIAQYRATQGKFISSDLIFQHGLALLHCLRRISTRYQHVS